jgi:hypothetical protein
MTCYNSELPIGPPGPTGPVGPQGPQGPSGTLPYKVYTALLTQSGEIAPTVIELENTIGEITFGYNSIGNYTIISNNLFINNKIALFMGNMVTEPDVNISCQYIDDSTIYMYVNQANSSANGELTNTPIEIRIYP